MNSTKELRDIVNDALKWIQKHHDVTGAEVYASSNELIVLRMSYASNIPNNALEEAKSIDDFGIGIKVDFRDGKVGFGKSDSALDANAIKEAFEKAKKNSVKDEDFHSLPEPAGKGKLKKYHDEKIMKLDNEKAVEMSYDCLDSALNELGKKKFSGNVNMTGELDFLKERMAIASSTGIDNFDESTIAIGHLTTIFELENDISGMWFDSATSLKAFKSQAIGKNSVNKALSLMNPQRIESGTYKAVLGRLAMADILYSRFDVELSSMDVQSSPYLGMLDKKISNYPLNIYDDGITPGLIGTKKITDEGIPTQKTQLVKDGVLVNLLADDYYAKKYKAQDSRYNNSNGFRFAGLGRAYYSEASTSATNVVVGKGKFSDEELIKEIKNGIYIGRIWYTYPINGAASPDFSSTIRGDSYIIENGKIKCPLAPNILRINDSIHHLLNNVIGLSKKQQATISWGEKAVVVTPEMAVSEIHLDRIGKGLY
ncbi:MAG: TldD/PmbA family protein [archaeon]|nr:TldD/PmbA family protein [archaeon]